MRNAAEILIGALAKKQLFCKLWFAGLACSGLQMCCFVGWVSFVFVWGRKNKINSLKFALTYQRTISILFQFYRYRIRLSVSFLHLPLTFRAYV